MTGPGESPRRTRDFVLEAHDRLRALLPALTDGAEREPSALPGWSRAHLLSHVEGVALAQARQARYALRGELVEVYDGGRPARAAAIEAGAVRGAAELRTAVTAALDSAADAWSAVGPDDWGRRVAYRDGVLLDALLAWWREVEIHTADARLGSGTREWRREFCAHALDFLAPRAPEGVRLTLVATDGPERRTLGGAGRPLTVAGRLTDLTAWLAGRAPEGQTTPPVENLPPLLPWP
ncbi:maleylpyruvate isomerase family mycothiol-dependent enzyme [Streptomyces sp. RFCAC02]|uniref:maleylpyruvate isomerase family mycothiol-dependent enzyme n=1 Tax=Streptomyces sp. RFCAC02 TaxID=2499143 RepID=UPI001F0D112B|nr:maleylpyruvate isomerase family mycothiol-dependent enzyme [Streptomyces sp. RFCAC02]